MGRRTASAALLTALLLAGCGSDREDVPAACLAGPATIEQALERAPADARLTDGTLLSTCVSRVREDADLQALGASLMQVADRLSARADSDEGAALKLGYLAGAAHRGVAGSPGLAANLGRRIDQTTLRARTPATQAVIERGLRAGEAGG